MGSAAECVCVQMSVCDCECQLLGSEHGRVCVQVGVHV